MLKIILGAIVGFIVWTILLMSSDIIWLAFSPFYVTHQSQLKSAVINKTPFMADTTVMVICVVRSAIFTIITGVIAALISKESVKSPILLGIFLLAFGLFVHLSMWNNVPVWYHILILIPLIPLAIVGGKLKKD